MNNDTIKILLVDDEPDILEILSYNLIAEGYTVVTAANGLEAVKSAKKNQPHLIIMDVMMPEMDGIEACEQIRAFPELKGTIITFLTALSSLGLRPVPTTISQNQLNPKYWLVK